MFKVLSLIFTVTPLLLASHEASEITEHAASENIYAERAAELGRNLRDNLTTAQALEAAKTISNAFSLEAFSRATKIKAHWYNSDNSIRDALIGASLVKTENGLNFFTECLRFKNFLNKNDIHIRYRTQCLEQLPLANFNPLATAALKKLNKCPQLATHVASDMQMKVLETIIRKWKLTPTGDVGTRTLMHVLNRSSDTNVAEFAIAILNAKKTYFVTKVEWLDKLGDHSISPYSVEALKLMLRAESGFFSFPDDYLGCVMLVKSQAGLDKFKEMFHKGTYNPASLCNVATHF